MDHHDGHAVERERDVLFRRSGEEFDPLADADRVDELDAAEVQRELVLAVGLFEDG